MTKSPKRSQVLTLAMIWLLAISLWAPMNTLKHLEQNHLSSGGVTVAQQQSATSDASCVMKDCSNMMSHFSHCDVSCQTSMNTVSSELIPALTNISYVGVDKQSYKVLSPAIHERPPKYFV